MLARRRNRPTGVSLEPSLIFKTGPSLSLGSIRRMSATAVVPTVVGVSLSCWTLRLACVLGTLGAA